MYNERTVREIVIEDYRAADVFKRWGISYCCGGNLPLREACALKQISHNVVEKELARATQNVVLPNSINFDQWPVEFLVDYVVHVHHNYLWTTLPDLTQFMQSFVDGHSKKYPYLLEVKETFSLLASELKQHMKMEEESIFPYVKQISHTYKRKEVYGSLFVKTLRKPLAQIIDTDHGRIFSLLLQVRKLTKDYSFDEKVCPNHQVLYKKLKELDADLVQHKYLENEFLFPRALEMEKSLVSFTSS